MKKTKGEGDKKLYKIHQIVLEGKNHEIRLAIAKNNLSNSKSDYS